VRFLADENCDFVVVRALRAAGHDVRALAEETSRSVDVEVIGLAAREQRILMTEDKDFGWLAFVGRVECAGVILIRFPGHARQTLAQVVRDLVSQHGEELQRSFTVVQPGQARITPKPDSAARE
jgi:predicted nuclease of predicted toxin-antitoxin system